MTRRIEQKCWAESLCVEPSGQKCCAEGSTPFPNLGFFYGKRLFFIIEEATQTSILCRETLAPEAAPPMQILARSNFERTIRSLGPIPSNLQVIYHPRLGALLVITFGDVCCSSHIDRSFYRKKKTFVEGSCKDESEASTCSAGGIRSNRY